MTVAEFPLLMTIEEVACRFQVLSQTIRRWLGEDRIPQPVKLGKRPLFGADEIEKWTQRDKVKNAFPVTKM